MLVQSKVQIESDDYAFIKEAHKKLRYRSISEYVRDAVSAKVMADRRRVRELKRLAAMQSIGDAVHEDIFGPIAGEDFEDR